MKKAIIWLYRLFAPFTKDKGILTGSTALYLLTLKGEHLCGGFFSVNCMLMPLISASACKQAIMTYIVGDVDERKNTRTRSSGRSSSFLNATLSSTGHMWNTAKKRANCERSTLLDKENLYVLNLVRDVFIRCVGREWASLSVYVWQIE